MLNMQILRQTQILRRFDRISVTVADTLRRLRRS
ncbi:unnamed protein product [Acanthoscelides obtectus]|uniref:Uncharacterized protein n=1 Tax=Acanthoscelides obtectus TaxID=200917 RepID=A0A9P0JYP4_ACAOB|nr:unnamed protein product [Acanthoscelides obtectus]CAK1658489.1 hypothetical protein AOBTE_LOCUS20931 [Acanthoscelides obtectus]